MIRKVGLICALLGLGLVASAAPATASVTIGQLAPADPPVVCSGGPNDLFQSSLASGTSYTVPFDGTITQWSTNAAAGAGQTLKMKVFRPVSGTTYTVVGHDGPQPLAPSLLNNFTASIPVKAGDVIGYNDQNAPAANNACLFNTGQAGDVFGANPTLGDAADGSSESMPAIASGFRLNLTALVVPVVPVVPAPAGPTGQRAAALAKCKKKAKKKHWSKKRLRKCKKKARLLPV